MPYIRMPMRKIFAALRKITHVAPSVSAIDSAICQKGGVCTQIRMNITIGVKIGMSETMTEMVESGWPTKKIVAIIGIIRHIWTGDYRFCASCSELQTAPMHANIAVYMK